MGPVGSVGADIERVSDEIRSVDDGQGCGDDLYGAGVGDQFFLLPVSQECQDDDDLSGDGKEGLKEADEIDVLIGGLYYLCLEEPVGYEKRDDELAQKDESAWQEQIGAVSFLQERAGADQGQDIYRHAYIRRSWGGQGA